MERYPNHRSLVEQQTHLPNVSGESRVAASPVQPISDGVTSLHP